MNRQQETATVKKALIHAGFDQNNIRVSHGNGTAWGWLHVHADIQHKPDCSCICPEDQPRQLSQECKDKWSDCYQRISEVVIAASGRNKYESEQINYSIGFFA